MKKTFKIILPIIIFALAFSSFCIGSFADENAITTSDIDISAKQFDVDMSNEIKSYQNGETKVTYNVMTTTVSQSTSNKAYYNVVGQGGIVVKDTYTNEYNYNAYYQVYSFDIATESTYQPSFIIYIKLQYIDEGGTSYKPFFSEIKLENGVITSPYGSIELEKDPLSWNNLTFAFDFKNNAVSAFVNGKALFLGLVPYKNYQIVGVECIRPTNTATGDVGKHSLAMTNAKRYTYTENGYLKALFDGSISNINGSELVLPYNSPNDCTPSPNEAKIGDKEYAFVKDAIANYVSGGHPITLLRNVKDGLYIDKECIVDTNGFNFPVSTTLEYYAERNGNTVSVKKYDGKDTVEVLFLDNKGLPFPEYENGGLEVPLGSIISQENIPTVLLTGAGKFYGWSYEQDGDLIDGELFADGNKTVNENGQKILRFYAKMKSPKLVVNAKGTVAEYEDITAELVRSVISSSTEGTVIDLYESVELTGASMEPASGLKINLHGCTLTWSGSGKMIKSSRSISIVGHDEGGVRAGFAITINDNLVLLKDSAHQVYLKNLDIEAVGCIVDNRGGTATFEGCNINYTGTGFVTAVQPNNAAQPNPTVIFIDTNVTMPNGGYLVYGIGKSVEHAQIWTISLEGKTSVETSGNVILSLTDTTSSGSAPVVKIGKDVKFTTADGSVGFSNKNTVLKLYVEEGFSFPTMPVFSKVASITTLDGKAGSFELIDGKYVFVKNLETYTITVFVNGVRNQYTVISGEPSPIPTPDNLGHRIEGDKVYISAFSHWALTEGGSATEIDTTKDGTYYAVFKDSLPSYIIYSKTGAISVIGSNNVIPYSEVSANPEGKLVLYNNATLDLGGERQTLTFPFTFDLGGKTLILTNEFRVNVGVGEISEDGSSGLTFKNGELTLLGNFIYAQGETNIGSIYLHKITLNTSSSLVFDYRASGTIKMVDCTINSAVTSSRGMFSIGNYTSNPKVELINTDIIPTSATNKSYVFYLYTRANNKFGASILIDGCDFKLGANEYLFTTGDTCTAGSTFNITVRNSTVTGNTNKAYTGGFANLTTTLILGKGAQFNSGVLCANANVKVVCEKGYALIESDSGTYRYQTVTINSGLYANLTLYTDITLNFLIPKDNTVYGVKLGGISYQLDKVVNYNGIAYYKVSVPNIAINNIEQLETLEVLYGLTNEKATVSYSVIDYLENMLTETESKTVRKLIASTICYVYEAYSYDGTEIPERLTNLMSTEIYVEEAKNFSTEPVPQSSAKLGNINLAISSVQLNLSTSLRFRFNLQPSYTGTLNINGTDYQVVNGIYDSNGYIEISVYAFKLSRDTVSISDDNGISGEYDLRKYVHTDKTADGEASDVALDRLLLALYNYGEAARIYESLQNRN